MVSKKRCHNDNAVLRPYVVKDKVTVSGRTFAMEIPAKVCPVCREKFIPAGPLVDVENAAAIDIASNGPVDKDSFRFLRKKSGVKAADLAKLLGVRPETVSAWETGKTPVNRASWMIVAQLVLDRLEDRAPIRERLEAIAKGKRPRKRVNLSAA